MAGTKLPDNVKVATFEKVIGDKYLAYALSTIMSRSLPDVRDGLKPVHRRLLYAMLQLRLNPEQGFKKCARVVGDVIGKYHPHGDIAVYDTLVRLAQDFSLRYPLIEGQGNFGSIDGDNAAAMRYTEARLTPLAMYLMHDIDKNTVDFKPTYDDSDTEPSLMPSAFPNVLINGAEGIAVGMATSIPPHNLNEICQALIYLIDTPNATTQQLLQYVRGPDFPTGAIIVDNWSNIETIYNTGRGSIKIRAKWEIEDLSHNLYQIVITEIPYQVQKSRLIEQIANLLKDKKLPLISNIRDESTTQIRIIIEPKSRNCSAEVIMESLFKQTELESRFNYNLNVLTSKGLPEVLNLKQILQEFLDHRAIIINRSSKFDLNKTQQRLEILLGLQIVYNNLDIIIAIIRDEDEPKPALKARFNLTDNQAEAILNTKLRSLRKLDENSINNEQQALIKDQEYLENILSSRTLCLKVIKEQIKDLQKFCNKKKSVQDRRTAFVETVESETIVNLEALIEREQITIIYSKQGWIRAIKGLTEDSASFKFKEGDNFKLSFSAYTTDYLNVVTAKGRFYTILADSISKGKGYGESIRTMIDITPNDDIVYIGIYTGDRADAISQNMLLISSAGKGFTVRQIDTFAQTKLGKQVMNLDENEQCIKVLPVAEENMVACISSARKLLVFPLSEIPILKRGQGVILQKLANTRLSDIQIFNAEIGFKWSTEKYNKVQLDFGNWLGKRGGVGKLPPFGFVRSNTFYSNLK